MDRIFQLFTASLAVVLFTSVADAATMKMLLESDEDRSAGSEVFFASYDTFDDLVSGTISRGDFSDIGISSAFSVGGLAYDGAYHVLLESDEDRSAGSEVFFASYDTFDDLVSGTISRGDFSDIGISSAFSVGGLAYDGAYHVLLESDEDRSAGSEVFFASYDTFDDLVSGTISRSDFSDIGISSAFSVGGLAYEAQSDDGGPAVVPLPAGGMLLLSALASALTVRRKGRMVR